MLQFDITLFMGKKPRAASAQKLQQLTKLIAANNPPKPIIKPKSIMEASAETSTSTSKRRYPLSAVVSDCVKRWFQDTLKEAKSGDVTMQVLVGQMYSSGYGIVADPHKGRAWISRASRIRSSALKVGNKRPGYNASDSDSDSDEVVEEAK